MKEYELFAGLDADQRYSLQTCYGHNADVKNAYIAGFLKAREMACDLWADNDHKYCDFYYDGGLKMKMLGEKEG